MDQPLLTMRKRVRAAKEALDRIRRDFSRALHDAERRRIKAEDELERRVWVPKFFNLNPMLVYESVFNKVCDLEDQRRHRTFPDEAAKTRFHQSVDQAIDKEITYYANVVIRADYDGYRLVYSTDTTGGTGPFRTLTEARRWFIDGGR